MTKKGIYIASILLLAIVLIIISINIAKADSLVELVSHRASHLASLNLRTVDGNQADNKELLGRRLSLLRTDLTGNRNPLLETEKVLSGQVRNGSLTSNKLQLAQDLGGDASSLLML